MTMSTLAPAAPTPPIAQFAGRDTPLIRNCWYVAAHTDEVGREMTARTFLDTKVVLYRTEAGEAIALHDRCLHRSYPLSRGTLDGDDVVCGYHGMRFGADGRCTRIPTNETNSLGKIAVQRFALEERGPLVWIWMGDPDRADPALIPSYDWLTSADWVHTTGSFEIDASYVALHENLLDLTHLTYLHASTVGTPEFSSTPLEFLRDGGVGAFRKLEGHEPPPRLRGRHGVGRPQGEPLLGGPMAYARREFGARLVREPPIQSLASEPPSTYVSRISPRRSASGDLSIAGSPGATSPSTI